VFSEKEPVRLDGRGAGAMPERVMFWRFGCSSELVLLCERVLSFSDFGWGGRHEHNVERGIG